MTLSQMRTKLQSLNSAINSYVSQAASIIADAIEMVSMEFTLSPSDAKAAFKSYFARVKLTNKLPTDINLTGPSQNITAFDDTQDQKITASVAGNRTWVNEQFTTWDAHVVESELFDGEYFYKHGVHQQDHVKWHVLGYRLYEWIDKKKNRLGIAETIHGRDIIYTAILEAMPDIMEGFKSVVKDHLS